jgi:hypothetical protein
MGKPNSSAPPANYGNFQTELYAQIRREAFGEDIGQNSWLTSDEQDRFLEWLDLSPEKALLDVACGAGGQRCESPSPLDVLSSALTFMNRR